MFVTKYLSPDSEGGGGAEPTPVVGGTTLEQLFSTVPVTEPTPLVEPVSPAEPVLPVEPVEEEEEVVEDTTAFYQDVNKIWGREYEVEYGDLEPLSPEGVQLREKLVYDSGVEDADMYFQRTNPRAYAYKQHLELGKSDEDFFNNRTLGALPVKETLIGNAAIQEQVYRSYLNIKGITDEETITDLITGLKASNKLESKSNLAYDEMENSQVQALSNYRDEVEKANKKIDNDINSFKTAVANVVKAGYTDNLIIAEAKKSEFEKFVQESTMYDPATGSFMFVQTLDPTKLSLTQLYFAFNGGNIDQLVERKVATSQVVKKLGVVPSSKKPTTPHSVTPQKGNTPISSL